MEMENLQKYQCEIDEKCFELNDGFKKIRHIALHLVKTMGKLATYCEAMEHESKEVDDNVVINEVIPDLLIHSLQLSNCFNIILVEKYHERIKKIVNKYEKKT